MKKTIVMYNPLSDSGNGGDCAIRFARSRGYDYSDLTQPGSLERILRETADGNEIVICGGDGTINRLANALRDAGVHVPDGLFYYATGSGNDFLRDLGAKAGADPVPLSKYLYSLPSVTVNGAERLFVNGVGFGIDGYCCEEGDRRRAAGIKKTNYTAIALKGLFGAYEPRRATVSVDGAEYTFDNVWLAPIMNGRYFGGGMMPAPEQDRLSPEGKLTLMLFSGRSRIATLVKFPKLFKGTHVSLKGCHIFTGDEIKVRYEIPTALQIDGETVSGVLECVCRSSGLRKRTMKGMKKVQ